MPYKWESTRGIGFSFGYNQNEGPEHHLPVDTLIRMFVDIVSKNGNLLLNVGPMADGTIPELQRERLEGLSAWLARNGEAIFDTRPWVNAEGNTADGIPVRYTQTDDALYAILLDTPRGTQVRLAGLRAAPKATVHLCGSADVLSWQPDGDNLVITLPDELTPAPAHALEITPKPAAAA
jgi:alpha-L-fucosidase